MTIPRVVRVRQTFKASSLDDIEGTVTARIDALGLARRVRPGASVAVGCSSRGIANYAAIVKATLDGLQRLGLRPFLFPAMGSHGAATAEGQKQVLEAYGLSEAAMGVPIRSSLDTVHLGALPEGVPVQIDRHAQEADHIVLINRVKAHTEFTHDFESGLLKMMVIGMGKERGATLYHKAFMIHGYPKIILSVAERVMATGKVLFGVGIVEDAFCNTAAVEALPPERLLEGEKALLGLSKALSPRLPFDDVDVLVIDEMGKDISGAGFDSKVVGRILMPLVSPEPESPRVKRIVVCDLTDKSAGNADGIGVADFITRRLYDKIDLEALYVNALAGSEPEHARIPMTMASDREAVAAGVNTVGLVAPEDLRLLRIKNTLRLDELEMSEAYLTEAAGADVEVLSEPYELAFDAAGGLRPLFADDA